MNQLSERQRQLLDLVGAGVTASKVLANETGLAVGTIDNQLQNAAKLLGVSGRMAAADRYRQLRENSHEASHMRISTLPPRSDSVLSGLAGAVRRAMMVLADFLRGPPLGGGEHSLRWDQVTLQVLRVAVIGLVAVVALVLVVLGFFKTFG